MQQRATTPSSRTTRPGPTHRYRRHRRAAVAVTGAAALLAGLAGPAQAGPQQAGRVALRAAPAVAPVALPDGWSLADGGTTLRWTSRTPLPLGGARLDVVADGAVLGTGRLSPDRRTVSLAVDAGAVKDPASLQVVAAGRRLDAGPTSVAASARTSARRRPPGPGHRPPRPPPRQPLRRPPRCGHPRTPAGPARTAPGPVSTRSPTCRSPACPCRSR
ncbi:hypothetical protein [Kineosporia sp. R_H_3]|uniref:hypothetical protein n=1 Tax=Kineosporia sp. R_H_3 TaxID=1961848 RepID=UPI000B4BF981|nr:hypothetical protein [Kineosporia sp. R_H_3]